MTSQRRFAELWTDYLEGELGDAGTAELQTLLAADESQRARAADLFQTHRLLGFALQDNTAANESFVDATLARVPQSEDDFVDSVIERTSSASAPPRRQRPGWLLARPRGRKLALASSVAVALCIAAALVMRRVAQPRPPERLATLTRATDCVWEGHVKPQPGDRLSAGLLRLRQGTAEIEWDNGVQVLVEGPARMELVDAGDSVLHAGKVVARVPPSGAGFAVDTPRARFVDLGTEFGVAVEPTRETIAQVFDGVVVAELKDSATDGKRRRRLTAGETVRIDASDGVAWQEVAFSYEYFLRTFSTPSVYQGDQLIPFKPSEVSSLDVLAVPGRVTIDGDLSDWDLSGTFEARCAEPFAEAYYVRGSMMYDEQHLYLAARVGDPMPMRNMIDPHTDAWSAWMGGGVQLRLSTDRGFGWPVNAKRPRFRDGEASAQDTSDRIVHLTLWYFQPREQPCLELRYGMNLDRGVVNPPGWQGAFCKSPDGRSYTVECAIPWTLLGAGNDPPRAGDELGLCWTVNWSDASGKRWKGQLVEIKNPPYADRGKKALTFLYAETWGKAIYR